MTAQHVPYAARLDVDCPEEQAGNARARWQCVRAVIS